MYYPKQIFLTSKSLCIYHLDYWLTKGKKQGPQNQRSSAKNSLKSLKIQNFLQIPAIFTPLTIKIASFSNSRWQNPAKNVKIDQHTTEIVSLWYLSNYRAIGYLYIRSETTSNFNMIKEFSSLGSKVFQMRLGFREFWRVVLAGIDAESALRYSCTNENFDHTFWRKDNYCYSIATLHNRENIIQNMKIRFSMFQTAKCYIS